MKYNSLEALREDLHNIPKDEYPLIKILFVPDHTTKDHTQLLEVYSKITDSSYDTVVFLETTIKVTDKKIPMVTWSEFKSEFGEVPVNDVLRNEFCDEDDDFFIDDHAAGPNMEIYKHLPYLQAALGDFKVVSVQICDEDPAIVREVAYVLSEIMGGRSALLIVSCGLPGDLYSINDIKQLLEANDQSNIMNQLNSGNYPVSGSAAFQSGVFVGFNWDLKFEFLNVTSPEKSALAGFAFVS